MKREIFEKAKELETDIHDRNVAIKKIRDGDLMVSWGASHLRKERKKDYTLLEKIKNDLIDTFEREVNAMTMEFNALGDPIVKSHQVTEAIARPRQ